MSIEKAKGFIQSIVRSPPNDEEYIAWVQRAMASEKRHTIRNLWTSVVYFILVFVWYFGDMLIGYVLGWFLDSPASRNALEIGYGAGSGTVLGIVGGAFLGFALYYSRDEPVPERPLCLVCIIVAGVLVVALLFLLASPVDRWIEGQGRSSNFGVKLCDSVFSGFFLYAGLQHARWALKGICNERRAERLMLRLWEELKRGDT